MSERWVRKPKVEQNGRRIAEDGIFIKIYVDRADKFGRIESTETSVRGQTYEGVLQALFEACLSLKNRYDLPDLHTFEDFIEVLLERNLIIQLIRTKKMTKKDVEHLINVLNRTTVSPGANRFLNYLKNIRQAYFSN